MNAKKINNIIKELKLPLMKYFIRLDGALVVKEIKPEIYRLNIVVHKDVWNELVKRYKIKSVFKSITGEYRFELDLDGNIVEINRAKEFNKSFTFHEVCYSNGLMIQGLSSLFSIKRSLGETEDMFAIKKHLNTWGVENL